MAFTLEQILALSPDDASAKAARGLVAPGKWPTLGRNDAAIWGECQGSGAKPYQVQIDLAGPAFRCSCPSRKFPCKHGLALFILSVQHASSFAAGASPAWVEEWLATRRERAEKQDAKAVTDAAKPPDPAAAARREARRQERMAAGMDELERWLHDQVRAGIGALAQLDAAAWGALAARLVDAQLPGLAQRLRAVADLPPGRHWHAGLLAELGGLQLLIDAFRGEAALTVEQRADLRVALGMTQSREDALAHGERVSDHWTVAGVQLRERDRLWERATWLQGVASGRQALLLEFSHGEPRFPQGWITGATLQGELVFHPGALPLRALAEGLQAGVVQRPRFAALADNLRQVAVRLAAVPWQAGHLLLLARQTLIEAQGQWWWRDDSGQSLPLACSAEEAWQLMAVCGGAAADVAGVWDGCSLRLLGVWREGLVWMPGLRA